MIFKRSLIIIGLILTACMQSSFLLAAEIALPLPVDAIKLSEEKMGTGMFKSTAKIYQTSLSESKIEAFYKKEMSRAGWSESIKGLFMKDGYTVAVVSNSLKNEKGITQFLVTINKLPDRNELLAQRKAKPDKLNFMPMYPGCMQNFLWDDARGLSASYGTEDNIKDVIFFYKTAMLSYGWYLYSEIPLKEEAIKPSSSLDKPLTSSNASLRFRKKTGEACFVRIISISGLSSLLPGEQLVDKNNTNLPSKTSILIVYNEKKRINP